MADAESEKKIEVLKKAVLKLKSQNLQLDEEVRKNAQQASAAEAEVKKVKEAHEASLEELRVTKNALRDFEDEVEGLTSKNKQLTARLAQMEGELKTTKDRPAGGGFFSGVSEMMQAATKTTKVNNNEDFEKLEELLMEKTKEGAELQSKLFEVESKLREATCERDVYRGKYGEETVEAVSKISRLEEDLKVAKDEEARLQEVLAARAEELSQLEVQHRASLASLQELQARVAASGLLTRTNVLADTSRNPHLASIARNATDRERLDAAAQLHSDIAAVLGNIVRDVEALFANATERVHILLSKATATAGPVKVAALRLLKDSLRKANTDHARCAKGLMAAVDSATGGKRQAASAMHLITAALAGDAQTADDPAAAVAKATGDAEGITADDGVQEGVSWAAFLAEHLRFVLDALFAHSPASAADAGDEEVQEEIARLLRVLLDPLAQLRNAQVGPSTMRLLKNSVKEITEVVSGLFAKEVRVAWELAGFDAVNKRISAVLSALHSNISRAVDLRNAIFRQREAEAEGARQAALAHQRVSLLPPAEFVPDAEKALLPDGYFGAPAPYKDATTAKLRLHCRAAAFAQRTQAAVALVTADDFAPAAAAGVEGAAATVDRENKNASPPSPSPAAPLAEAPHHSAGALDAWDDGFVDSSCALLGFSVDGDATGVAGDGDALLTYRHYLQCADAKAVEYRVEWQRALFDLEERVEQIQDLELENMDLKRRLKNRDIEVKNMSHGYTDQMKVLQDRILDLQNRLASATAGGRGR